MIFIILLIVMMVILSAMNRTLNLLTSIPFSFCIPGLQLMRRLTARKSAYYQKPLGTKCRFTPVALTSELDNLKVYYD